MNSKDFGAAFETSGEVTTAHLSELVAAGMGGDPTAAALKMLEAALLEFSRVRPYVITTAAAAWAGTAVTLTSWYGMSELRHIECPTGAHPKTLLLPEQYDLDTESGALYLIGVDTGTLYSVRYTALHQIPAMPTGDGTATPITIPDAMHAAYYKLAAAHVFDRLAARYAETTGASFTADSVSYQTKSGEYSRLAKAARAAFRTALGVAEEPHVGYAGFVSELDPAEYRSMPEVW